MKPIYKSLSLAAMTLQVSLALNAETRDDESASTMALQAELLDSLRVELVAQNVSGARNLIESGECVIDGSNLTITLDTSDWTRGAMYRVQVLATFGTQTQVIYALNVTVPYYIALSDTPQEFSDNVTIVSTITDVTEADLEGLALEATSQEIKAAITPISQAAEAYNTGKVQLAQNITSKGVEASATETLPELAEKVSAIAQETYEIDGGEMYAKQLFGSLETPNYWNLYDVLAQLLSDGRLVNYGGILLAEYYRGYDSLALSGAGAGGAYVVSDKDENGNFIMYTSDTTHTWDSAFDGKGNRWVAYCFADAGHDFQITDTNTSPCSIFIGRNVGTIESLTNARTSQLIVPDGNELKCFNTGTFSQNWDSNVVIINLKHQSGYLLRLGVNTEKVFIQADILDDAYLAAVPTSSNLSAIILQCREIRRAAILVTGYQNTNNLSFLCIDGVEVCSGKLYFGLRNSTLNDSYWGHSKNLKKIYISNSEEIKLDLSTDGKNPLLNLNSLYFGYITNDKTKSFDISGVSLGSNLENLTDVELQGGWCKPINVSLLTNLTEANMYAHILQRLKQDEEDCGDGVTITLGATNLAKLTSAESVQLLDDLTNIYGYTFA